MMIKSNTLGKLQKIKNGTVFESPLIFTRELLQNSQRSRANTVHFYIEGDTLVCEDDGCGCAYPENVFTLDLSDWESTNEGYGIGFWSCLAVPDIRSINVLSKNWHFSVDTVKLFEEGDLTVKQEEAVKQQGFKVILKSPWFWDSVNAIEDYIFEVAKYLPLKVYINDLPTPHYDIFDCFVPDSFCKSYDNRYFNAKLAVSNDYYCDSVDMYYESRFVKKEDYGYVAGVIEPKKGRITLREPDRTWYTKKDEVYAAFKKKLDECIIDLYKSYVAACGLDEDSYNDGISYWLELKDYEKYLSFESDMLQASRKIAGRDVPKKEEKAEAASIAPVDQQMYKKDDSVTAQDFRSTAAEPLKAPAQAVQAIQATVVEAGPAKTVLSFKSKVKNMKKAVWVRKNEYDIYKDDIQVAKYKGLNVIVAKNRLYAQALESYGIVHISELKNHFHECYVKNNIEIRNGKEAVFMALLRPVCKRFGLPDDTFLICNLSIESSFEVDGKILAKEKIKNGRDGIKIYGVAGGGHIYLDRDALGLSRFNLRLNNNVIGIHEIKALMANVNTIAHEMAHLLNGTKDNTPEHYQAEVSYQRDIIALYV